MKKAIITRYHAPRAIKGARYTASDGDGNRVSWSESIDLDRDGNHQAAARALCAKLGWRGTLIPGALVGTGVVWVWLDVESTKEAIGV